MQLAIVSPRALQEQIHATWGKDPSRLSTLAEAIRCELSARTTSSRKALCERVQSLLAPVVQFDQETIRDALDMLESSGDITSGPGGIVASAPLRAVQLMEGVYLLFSSAPTTQLSSQLPVLSIAEGVERRAEISAENTISFQEAVQDLGGLVLSSERWAGLDRVLPAGSQWIEGLDLRLKQAFKPAGGWEGELVIPWRVYLPDSKRKSQRESWKKEVAEGHLWQAKNNRNRWLYAWTGGESPEIQSFVRLNNDDACRTMFSLDMKLGLSQPALARTEDAWEIMNYNGFIPRAEYRYLMTMGHRQECESTAIEYRFPLSVWDQVAETLGKRLGITIELNEVAS